MSDEKIDHAALANQAVSIAGMREALEQGESLSDIAAVAQVHATLALVEQQRISNALRIIERPDVYKTVAEGQKISLWSEIWKGLGL